MYRTIIDEYQLDGAPTRIVVGGDDVFVTLRSSDEVVHLTVNAGRYFEEGRFTVGAEPYGLAFDAPDQRLYVAASSDGQVEEHDSETGELLRSWSLPGQPRWLALHPNGDNLYVASAYGAAVHAIDLVTGEASPIALPDFTSPAPQAIELFISDRIALTPRITGDISVSTDGQHLALPLLLVDTMAPVRPRPRPDDGVIVDTGFDNGGAESAENTYGGGGLGINPEIPGTSSFNPAIFEIPLQDGEAVLSQASLVATMPQSGHFSYLSGVAYEPGTRTIWAPIEGSSVITSVDMQPFFDEDTQAEVYFEMRPSTFTRSDGLPNSVAFSENRAYVYNFAAQNVTELDRVVAQNSRMVHRHQLEELRESHEASMELEIFEMVWADHPNNERPNSGLSFRTSLQERNDVLSQGTSMFYAANNPQMSATGSGASCASCHFDGRNDGLTWTLVEGQRQTPSLAGGISPTAPFTWNSNVATVLDELMLTSQNRMGGTHLDEHSADIVVQFIEHIPAPRAATRADDAQLARGAALYVQAGCDSCHSGALLTDNRDYTIIRGMQANTPTLRGVFATAPYFHDGSAATLREVLLRSRDGSMGDTAGFSAQDFSDLEAYLRSL